MNNFKDNIVYKKFTENEIMIIGSIIEKEGLDREDKKKISSVIFNRLNKNMKLQIDATVIYAITKGQYNLKRKLLFKDLEQKYKSSDNITVCNDDALLYDFNYFNLISNLRKY